MVRVRKYELPAVYAALGTAVAFYFFPFLSGSQSRGVFFVAAFIIPLGFLEAVSQAPFLYAVPESRFFFKKLRLLTAFAAGGFGLGLTAGAVLPAVPSLGLEPERITGFLGILAEDPRSFNDSRGMGALDLLAAVGEGGVKVSAKGKVLVFFPAETIPRLREFGRGCEIYTEGSLAAGDRGFLFRAASVHVTRPASPVEQFRTALRGVLLEKISGSGGSAPVWSGLASALLLGVRDNLDNAMAAGFRNAGCSHVLALSGMHLALLSGVIAFFLKRLLGIRAAVLAGGVFIVFYVFLAGGQPSLVRAEIMYLIGAVCFWGFLKKEPFNLLCLAFVTQIVIQPESGGSVSFVLSYLALAGILTVGETIRELFRGRIPEILSGSLAASVGAFLLTAPAVSLYFGTLMPIGLLAGMIVVPVASLFMIVALGALVFAFVLPFLSPLFDFVLTLIYRVLDFLVSFSGKVPALEAANPTAVLAFVLVLCGLLMFLCSRDRAMRSNIAPFVN
jgi:competence protein ComEC